MPSLFFGALFFAKGCAEIPRIQDETDSGDATMKEFAFSLAGVTIPAKSEYFCPSPQLLSRFAPDATGGCALQSPAPVCITDEEWSYFASIGMDANPVTEFSLLTAYFSDALLPFDRAIVHGVAVRYRGRAWLICAGSGTGKSTQLKHLNALRPGEFSVICGDRPVLEFCPASSRSPSPGGKPSAMTEEYTVVVHPSPWNGKENWYGAEAAPLAGLILLERGEENRLHSIPEREAAIPMYTCFIHTGISEAGVRKIAELETKLLRAVPIWRLTTHQVPDSTKLLLDAVFQS